MWFLLLLYLARTEPVISQASTGADNRLILKGKTPCEGHIEIFHNGIWGYLGDTKWDSNIEDVVCRSAHCGNSVSMENVLRSENRTVWLNEVSCTGQEAHPWGCHFPDKIKFLLDGDKCAGAVQYSINGQKGYFCADKWEKKEADFVCGNLQCGTAKEFSNSEWSLWKEFPNSPKMRLSCSGIEDYDNLWQCVTGEYPKCSNPVSVICTAHERLQLKKEKNSSNACSGQLQIREKDSWKPVTNSSYVDTACQRMHCGNKNPNSGYSSIHSDSINLTCTDNVSVVLIGKDPRACYGRVHMTVNGKRHPVCGSTWEDKDAQVVCKELNCGEVVLFSKQGQTSQSGIMDNVKCSGTESSLWHCSAKRDKTPFPCSEAKYPHIVCSDSMKVKLVDSPGECAGRVEIQYEGEWRRVNEQGWTDKNSNTVCKQLSCGGKKSSSEKYSQGSAGFLSKVVNCKSDGSDISKCIENNPSVGREDKAVSITCEEHKVLFLEGTCSGRVGIEHRDKTYWLSGDDNSGWNKETADTVCRQMHCGRASEWDFINSTESGDIWKEVYKCSSTSTSLFKCAKLQSDFSETVHATVKCSGSITMSLTEGCWGTVKACMGGECGEVCNDAWTEEKAKMLCKDLGCGDKVLPALNKPQRIKAAFKSLHATRSIKNLTQCNFVKNDENSLICEPAYVVCSGSVKSKFSASSSRLNCSGNVEVFYEGQNLPVCKTLDKKAQNAICEELNCGQADGEVDYFGPKSEKLSFISSIGCPDNAKSLSACTITHTNNLVNCIPVGLQCSGWKKMELKFHKKACSGAVFVHSREGKKPVSSDSWNGTEGNKLCKVLKCGSFKSFLSENTSASTATDFWSGSFSCGDAKDAENIWKCEKAGQPSQKKLLTIECQDEPKVTLSGNCRGEVRINNIGVCGAGWSKSYSDKVCQEMLCGNSLYFDYKVRATNAAYHVRCEEYHDRLGMCDRFEEQCSEGLVSVYCVGNATFKTTKKCGGQIEVNYRNRWEKLLSFPPDFRNELCKNELHCGVYNLNLREDNKKYKKDDLETTVECTSDYKDFKYCIQHMSSSSKERPAEIYCNGYVPEPTIPPDRPTSIVPIIVGIGFVLVLVILIAVFVRVYIVRRAKRAMNPQSRMYSRKEVEFESGDYEDVTTKSNEMEAFGHGRFRPDAEVITESDARSNSSFPYDDIDETVETLPLTSPAATSAGASEDNFGALDQSGDGVTYEVDDPQESYDDIEPGPEVTQTKAEVHASPETTPASIPAAPPGPVQGEEDYLVPGQDG
ncbi:scavenger receptor cysteine-rich type 1 protein M130 [Symphorus nematophorus]